MFQKFQTISSFGRNIYNGTITTANEEVNKDQGDLLVEILVLRNK